MLRPRPPPPGAPERRRRGCSRAPTDRWPGGAACRLGRCGASDRRMDSGARGRRPPALAVDGGGGSGDGGATGHSGSGGRPGGSGGVDPARRRRRHDHRRRRRARPGRRPCVRRSPIPEVATMAAIAAASHGPGLLRRLAAIGIGTVARDVGLAVGTVGGRSPRASPALAPHTGATRWRRRRSIVGRVSSVGVSLRGRRQGSAGRSQTPAQVRRFDHGGTASPRRCRPPAAAFGA